MPKKPLLLIVDDEPNNVRLLVNTLETEDYELAIAHNGEKALEIASYNQPDLILLDVMMPKMGGLETCQALKKDALLRNIPVIFLTALHNINDIEAGFKAGGVDYITKPFQIAELHQRITTHLELKRSREHIEAESHRRKQLLHMLFHDLRNPVGATLTSLQIMAQTPKLSETLLPIALDTTKQSLELLTAIGQLLIADDEKRPLHCQLLPLKNLVEQSIQILKYRFEAKKITVNLCIQPEIQVFVDPVTFVHSVVNNLLTNALKFSYPDGTVTVSSITNDEHWHIFSVRDHGTGMPEEMLETLFDTNKASSKKGTQGENGTGFGMPLIKSFVDRYGGTVRAISQQEPDDHGSEFFVRLRTQKPS